MKSNGQNDVDPRIFQLLVEQSRDYALFILDPTGVVRTWNAGAQRIKGYFPDEIIGVHFSKFYPPDALQRRWPEYELEMAIREGRFEDEGWRVRKDGSRFWASVTITALRDEHGELLGFSKITRDLSDRKLHEEALRQSEERFRLLIEGVVDYAIYMLNADGVITSWNSGGERIKGYPRDEAIGSHFSRFYSAEDVAAGKPWQELAKARRDGRAEEEGWRVRKDGTRFWARVVVSALHDEEGHLRGFAKVTQDLTERRHMLDLEQAARNLNEFIATLAHELRNPLAPIRSAVKVMAQLPAGDPGQEAMRQMIDRQSAHLVRIADDMIDIARISRGSITVERKMVELPDVVKRAVEAAMPQMEAAKHRLTIDCPPHLQVLGDSDRLTQIITNLLNNAARYTPASGDVTVEAKREGMWIYVRVRDNGRGIEPELMERIFDMFVQGRQSIQRVGGGLGIGLPLSRRLAEMHGGSLTAASQGAGAGAEFTLKLPAEGAIKDDEDSDSAAARPSFASHTQTDLVAKLRVLVVDDNVDAAISLQLLLRSLGHEVHVVHDGQTALGVATAFAPDVVLLDIGLPDLDGYEVARRLRRLATHAPMKIVALSGWGQSDDRERSRQAGFDMHLVKPVDQAELSAAFATARVPTLH